MKQDKATRLRASEYLKPFWYHWKLYPSQTCCHLSGIYQYAYRLDAIRLKRAIEKLVDSNYNLRSNFFMDEEGLQCVVREQVEVELASYSTNSDSERRVLIEHHVARPFHLSDENLFRIILIQHAESSGSSLLVVFHHIILDGTQFDEILQQLGRLYMNDSVNSDRLELNFLQSYLDVESHNIKHANVEFWLENAGKYSPPEQFPFLNKAVPLMMQRTRAQSGRINGKNTRGLSAFVSENQTSIFTLLKIVWASLIGFYCQQEKIMLVHPVCVRTKEFKQVKGSYINILPFGVDLTQSVRTLLSIERDLGPSYRKNRFVPTSEIITAFRKHFGKLYAEQVTKSVIAQADLRWRDPFFLTNYQATKIDLTPNLGGAILLLEYQESDNELCYQMNYLSPAVADEFVQKLSVHFSMLLEQSLLYPDQAIINLVIHAEPKQSFNCDGKSIELDFCQLNGSHWR